MTNKSKKILTEISAGELLDKITILEIKLVKIKDKEKLNDLTNSIKERGIIQPIIVRKSNDQKSKYEIWYTTISWKSQNCWSKKSKRIERWISNIS